MEMGTLGSMYTSLEGLLTKARGNLVEGNPFYLGDSSTVHHGKESENQRKFREFLERFQRLIVGKAFPFTLVLRDPLGNSFIGSLEHEDPADDPNIEVCSFWRSFEENDDLGLNDINTDNYERCEGGRELAKVMEEEDEEEDAPRRLPHRVENDHPAPFTKGQEEQDDTKPSPILA
ncbi:unnamed protein product [Choristocarpus tenellus]